MAIVIASQPEEYGLAYNDNPWCFYESTLLTPSRRFIIKVIDLSATVIGQFTVLPSVNSAGGQKDAFFDPKRILQTKVESCIAIPSANNAVYSDCSTLGFSYGLFIESQDKDANGVYQTLNTLLTDVKTVWNGGVNMVEWLSFDYTDYDFNASASGKSFLTNSPDTLYIDDDQSLFLSFLSSDNDIDQMDIATYDANGGLIDFGYMPITMNEKFGYIAVGTYDLQNSNPSLWVGFDPTTGFNNAAYYIVSVSGTGAQSNKTIYINQRCSKYEPIRLHWLNRLGGYDSFNFSLKSMEETEIDRRSYHQNPHTFRGGNFYDYQTYSRGVTDYHVGTQRKLTVNTPYLTEAESVWMEDFATSPVIFQEVNNQLIAMSGKAKMIKKQTSLNDKLMQYEFELDYSLNDMRQRG